MQVPYTSQVCTPKIMFKKDFPTFAQVQHGVRQIPRDFNGMSRNALSPSLHLSTPSFSLLPRVPLWIWNQNEQDAGRSKFCHLLEVLQIAEMEPAGSSTLEHSPVLNQIWNSWQKTFVYQDIYIQTKIKIPILWYMHKFTDLVVYYYIVPSVYSKHVAPWTNTQIQNTWIQIHEYKAGGKCGRGKIHKLMPWCWIGLEFATAIIGLVGLPLLAPTTKNRPKCRTSTRWKGYISSSDDDDSISTPIAGSLLGWWEKHRKNCECCPVSQLIVR